VNPIKLFFLSLLCAIAGFILFAYTQQWIVFRFPNRNMITTSHSDHSAQKQKVTLAYWHANKWHTETKELLWTTALEKNCFYLINTWLALLEDETIMDRKISMQSALLSSNNSELYISFDRSPFNHQESTHTKWMWVEGLLKTLRENHLPISRVHFLVHHPPLIDDHLDFTSAWPINGFLTTQE
jgi:hypothetical protein